MQQELLIQQSDEQVEYLQDVCLYAKRSIMVRQTLEVGKHVVLEEIL
jgi:hypothetical protein